MSVVNTTVRALCNINNELANKRRVTEFTYIGQFNETSPPSTAGYFSNLITEDRNLKIIWSIDQKFYNFTVNGPYISQVWSWNKIKIKEANKNVHGDVTVTTLPYNTKECGIFDSDIPTWQMDLENTRTLSVERCPYNSITIKIRVFYEDEHRKGNDAPVTVVIGDYSNFLESQKLSDVVFIVSDQSIVAHQVIVSAYSEVFARMFDTQMQEKKNGRVEIKDVEPNIFKMILRFMYSGNFECNDTKELIKVINAADKYMITSLIKVCAARIFKNLNEQTVVYILIMADRVRLSILKQKCINFIVENRMKIVNTEGYKDLVQSGRTDLLSEIICNMK